MSEDDLINDLADKCIEAVDGKDVVGNCDTTTININNQKKRITNYTGLGQIEQNGKYYTLGFLNHAVLIHDAFSGIPLGISAVELWSRPIKNTIQPTPKIDNRSIPIEEKETYRWVSACLSSKEKLKKASSITFVMDREGDIIEVYDRIIDERTDVIVRSSHNRLIIDSAGNKGKLLSHIDEQPSQGKAEIKIKNNEVKRKSRTAKVDIKFGRITVPWPRRNGGKTPNFPEGIDLHYLEIKETHHSGYAEEPPLRWVLLTSKTIINIDQAIQIIKHYEQRWKIEVFFKLLKTDGYDIESTQLETGKAIRKLTILIMQASLKVQQLKAARSGKGELKVKDVFTEQEEQCLELMNEDY